MVSRFILSLNLLGELPQCRLPAAMTMRIMDMISLAAPQHATWPPVIVRPDPTILNPNLTL